MTTEDFPGPEEHPLELKDRYRQYLRMAYPNGLQDALAAQLFQAYLAGMNTMISPGQVQVSIESLEYTRDHPFQVFSMVPSILRPPGFDDRNRS